MLGTDSNRWSILNTKDINASGNAVITGTLTVSDTSTAAGTNTASLYAVQIAGGARIAKNLTVVSSAYFLGTPYIRVSGNPTLQFDATNSGGSDGYIRYSSGSSSSSTAQFQFVQYKKSYTTSSSGTTYSKSSYTETYSLPSASAYSTSSSITPASNSYTILTTKSLVTVSQGGTGSSSQTASRLLYTSSATKIASSGHYATSTVLGVNMASTAPATGLTFQVNGDSLLDGTVEISDALTAQLTSTFKGDATFNSAIKVDGNATIDGTLTLTNTTSAAGTSNTSPALIIGTSTGTHIAVDTNSIMAKNSDTTVADLNLNENGGTVNIGSGGVISSGRFTSAAEVGPRFHAKDTTRNLEGWFGFYDDGSALGIYDNKAGYFLIKSESQSDASIKGSVLPRTTVTGNFMVGSSTTTPTGTYYGSHTFKTANGFTYEGIESGTTDSARCIWFAHTSKTGTPVYNENFKYNPHTRTISLTNADKTTSLSANSSGNTLLTSGQHLYLSSGAGAVIIFRSDATERARFDASGHFIPYVTETYDLGSSTKAWNNFYIKTLHVTSTANATSATTGSIITAGGIGVAKDIYTTGNISINSADTTPRSIKATNSNGSVSTYTSTNRGLYDHTRGGWIIYDKKDDNTWVYIPIALKVESTTDSTSTTTGAIVTAGGLGVAKNIYSGQKINAAQGFGVNATTGTGVGISLYNGSSGTSAPAYGLMFATTTNFSTHGQVTGDWATYFTMTETTTTNRGWIFRHCSNNVASISGNGSLTLNGDIYYSNSTYTDQRMIRFVTGNNDGAGIVIGGGGLAVFGCGESANNLVTNASLAGDTETTYITSDSAIQFVTNCQTIANRVAVVLDGSRQLYPSTTNTGLLGTASYNWSGIHARALTSAAALGITSTNAMTLTSGGAFSLSVTGTTTLTSSSTIYIGNTSESSIIFKVNSTARARFNTGGHFVPEATTTYNLGSSSLKWNNVYTGTTHGVHNGNIKGVEESTGSTYSPLFINTGGAAAANTTEYTRRANKDFKVTVAEGTTSALGYIQLVLGNATGSGTAGNKYGLLRLYNQNTTYSDIQGNSVGSYGNLRISGTRGDYHGILFGNATSGMAIMSIDGSHQGLYNQAKSKWIIYHDGNGSVCIGGSAVVANYPIVLNGATYQVGTFWSSGNIWGNHFYPNADLTYSLGNLNYRYNTMYGHQLYLSGTTNATMTAASTNPRITFAESTNTQPVHLIYTDYDNYRSPAGLKVIGGDSATPAWFEVEGNAYIGNGYVEILKDGEGGTIKLHSKSDTYIYEIDAYNDETIRIHTASKNPNGVNKFISWNGKTGNLSLDGLVYIKNAYPAMAMEGDGSYWGMGTPDAGFSNWIRTTVNGIIPYSSDGTNGKSSLGTSSWPFATVYAKTFYGAFSGTATYGTYLGNSTNRFVAGYSSGVLLSAQRSGVTRWAIERSGENQWLTAHFYDTAGTWLSGKRLWMQGDAITGAVWNDYAEYRESDCIEPGYVLSENGDDSLSKTQQRLSHFAGISSDTWGFCQGETEKAKTPIAVAGRVLVYTYQNRENYRPGDCVCAAPDGTVDLMTREEIIQYPDRIVGTVSCVPTYEIWGSGDRAPVQVNGRIWIKVI